MADTIGPFDTAAWAEAEWFTHMPAAMPSGVIGSPATAPTTGGLAFTNSGLSVTLTDGRANISGGGFSRSGGGSGAAVAANTSSTNQRRDRIVLRRDIGAKTITPVVITGTPAATPVAPAITRSSTVFDLPMFSFLVPVSSGTNLTGVVDERMWVGPIAGQLSCYDSNARVAYSSAGDLNAGVRVYESSTGRTYQWDGSAWNYVSGGSVPRTAVPVAGSNWSNAVAGEQPLEYWKDSDGVVHVVGTARYALTYTPSTLAILGTLPAGFRPSGFVSIPIVTQNVTDLFLVGDITTGGDIRIVRSSTGSVPSNTLHNINTHFPAGN